MFNRLAIYIIIVAVVSGAAFGAGWKVKTKFVKAAQTDALQAALTEVEKLNVQKRVLTQELQDAEKNREVRIETITEKIPFYVTDKRTCDLTGDSVGLLNFALGDTLSSSLSNTPDGH